MSEAKSEGKGKGKKKGGKLPIILVAVLVLAGGGFFMSSKGKKEEKPKEPKLQLGEVVTVPDEILVNVGGDSRTFLACKIAFQLRQPDKDVKDDHVSIADPAGGEGGGHGGGGDATYSIVRNAVYDVLMSKKIDDLTKPDGMKYLKREIALAVNHAVHHEDPEKPEEDPKAKWEKEKKAKEEGSHDEGGHGSDHGEEIDHEWLDELGFDSDKGPVLKVLFTEFVWQKY